MASNLLVTAQSISKTYGAHNLFTNISLNFFKDERMGLIGPNGSGKSTLLKILADFESVDSGVVSKKKDIKIIYLAQEDVFDGQKTIEQILLKNLPQNLEDWQIDKKLEEIKALVEFENLNQTVKTLSGGWLKRLAITCAIIKEPDFLLADEPTNHLDLDGILWLEKLFKNSSFAFVLVTHDRLFLENTTNRIVELNKRYPDGFFKAEGNYSKFIQNREEFLNLQTKQELILSNKVRREIQWLRQGPKARSTKAKYRINTAYELQEDLSKLKFHNNQNKSVQIEFDATNKRTKKLLTAKKLSISYDKKLLFQNLNLTLIPKMCLGIIGPNGCGKTTLINFLNGKSKPDSGSIDFADNVKIVTFDQKRELSDLNQTLKRALAPAGDNVIYKDRSIHIFSWAKRFLFLKDQLDMPVSRLSGGEKARVLIANLMLKPADILLLDEPTNDLDIPTLEVLEESLEEFSGSVVLISHDRFLMNRLCDILCYLDNDGIPKFFSDFDQWLNYKNEIMPTEIFPNETKNAKSQLNKTQRQSYEKQKELNRIEKQIEKTEKQLESLQNQLNDPKNTSDSEKLEKIYNKSQKAAKKIEMLYDKWEKLEKS